LEENSFRKFLRLLSEEVMNIVVVDEAEEERVKNKEVGAGANASALFPVTRMDAITTR
jgi:hypothetical protein